MSSLIHAGIAIAFSGVSYLVGKFVGLEGAAFFAGPLFFYGREMKEYQKWREKQGLGSDNVLQLRDLNIFNYDKGGRGDGTLDVLYPIGGVLLCAIVCVIFRAEIAAFFAKILT